jgi:outer membrane protein assembly factor BamE
MTSIKHKTRLAALTAVLGSVLLAACSSYNGLTNRVVQRITPYRVTIVQGNFVSSEAAAKLRVGMTRDEVRNVIGTPLLTDMFHPERWDYIFYFKRGSTAVVEERRLVVFFQGDTVTSWTGADNLPTEQDLIAMIDGDRREKNLLEQKKAAGSDAKAARVEDAAGASAPVATRPGSTEPANQKAADSSNNALANQPARASTIPRNVPQSAVVHAGPQSAVQAPPEPQFRMPTSSHLRPAGGSSLLAQPPAMDDSGASSATGASSAAAQ